MLKTTKIRIYPDITQQEKLAKAFGCARWYWNNSLTETQRVYKETGKGYIEVNRFFPSSKTCSNCFHIQKSMPLNIRAWKCDKCATVHDRDVNAAQNIRNEAQRMIAAGIAGTASRGNVRNKAGRKSSICSVANEARSSVL